MTAFAKQDTIAHSNEVVCPTLEFFLGCHAVSGGSHRLQMDRDRFVFDEGSHVAVGEDFHDGVFV